MADALTLSVVPGDVGKPTARLDKVTIHDGSCKWETSVDEMVKFVRDTKFGKINEKIYFPRIDRMYVCMEILDFIVFLLYAKNENAHYIWSLTLVFMKGQAKSRVCGEVSINVAHYADARKSFSVSLP